MRKVRYGVAMSLDGYIAGPNGEFDWIVMDPDIDFTEIYKRFDTLLIGRKTFAAMKALDLLVCLDMKFAATSKLAHYVIAPKL